MKIFFLHTIIQTDTQAEKLPYIFNVNIRLFNLFSGMCETKYFVLPYMLHNIIVVKYVNFGGNFGFNHKNSIGYDILKFFMLSHCSSMRNDEKKYILLKYYLFYMKYKQISLFGSHFGHHLEFQYEESTFRLDTQAKKCAHCIIFNIQPSNLFSGGGGTKLFF